MDPDELVAKYYKSFAIFKWHIIQTFCQESMAKYQSWTGAELRSKIIIIRPISISIISLKMLSPKSYIISKSPAWL